MNVDRRRRIGISVAETGGSERRCGVAGGRSGDSIAAMQDEADVLATAA